MLMTELRNQGTYENHLKRKRNVLMLVPTALHHFKPILFFFWVKWVHHNLLYKKKKLHKRTMKISWSSHNKGFMAQQNYKRRRITITDHVSDIESLCPFHKNSWCNWRLFHGERESKTNLSWPVVIIRKVKAFAFRINKIF